MGASLRPATRAAYRLLHDGNLCFARMSAAGLKIDTDYLDRAIKDTKDAVAAAEDRLKSDQIYKTWVRHYGNRMKLESKVQLGRVVFDLCGHRRNPFMGRLNTEGAFEHLKVQFKKDYFDLARLKKALATNLYGIRRETVNGFCHPSFSTALAESYRSQSDKPNFHNVPVRNKRISEIVRSSVVFRWGIGIEADYGTQEVRGGYCYHFDPNLRYDVLHGDMHTDRALDLFMLTPAELGDTKTGLGKMIRYCAKNMFVFAQFYGSYYKQCAPALWDAISLHGLKTAQGVSLFDHLKSRGVSELGECDHDAETRDGTFEAHVRDVESRMWKDRYTVYDRWRRDWWESYQDTGGVNTLTGFKMEGVFRRNQILCDPIQGSSFHCELLACCLIQEEYRRRKMRSLLVNQIHDSCLTDTHPSEVEDVVKIKRRVMLEEVPKIFRWVKIPLEVEFEVCEGNWFNKKPMKLEAA